MINRRYVITAAHCHDKTKSAKTIREVVLGDHDLSQDPDCTDDEGASSCAQPVQRFPIHKRDVTVHESYDRRKVVTEGNDIALVRLPRPAYTNFEVESTSVIPICLPWGQLDNGNVARMPEGMVMAMISLAGFSVITKKATQVIPPPKLFYVFQLRDSKLWDGAEPTMIERMMVTDRMVVHTKMFFKNWMFLTYQFKDANPDRSGRHSARLQMIDKYVQAEDYVSKSDFTFCTNYSFLYSSV